MTELAKQTVCANEFSKRLIKELLSRKIVDDIEDVYGLPIADAIGRDIKITEFIDAMKDSGIPTTSKNYDSILKLIVIGDGDCSECGGTMEVTGGEYKQDGGDGYETPIDESPVWEQKTCPLCGHIVSNEPIK